MNRKNTTALFVLILAYGLIYRSFFSSFLSNTSLSEPLNPTVILEKRNALNNKIQEERNLDSVLSLGEKNHKIFENELLNFINHQADSLGLQLLGFTDISSSITQDSVSTKAYKINIQANYVSSLAFINRMDYEFPFSTIEHLRMTRHKPRRSKAVLRTEIILFK
ncbi:hypothetical protein OAC51_07480 [Flavobacteriaceae bacterium]|nr:hypothetical protein [Flavobacteriaceae bacterium]